MQREEDIIRAANKIRMQDLYDSSPDYVPSGSDIRDQQMFRKIDAAVDDELAGKRSVNLPTLPEGYTWLQYSSANVDRNAAPELILRVLAPDGKVIAPEEVSGHLFSTDRSRLGRAERIWERLWEGARDATIRHQWLLDPETQGQLDNFFKGGPVTEFIGATVGGAANLGALGFDLLNIPIQPGVAAASQWATEMQDQFDLPSWKYGASRPKDLWEAGNDAYKDWSDIAPIAMIAYGGMRGGMRAKFEPRSLLTKRERDVFDALDAGYALPDALYMARPYDGKFHHHFIPSSMIRKAKKDGRKWIVKLGESDWNKWQPQGWSKKDFVDWHNSVHKRTITSRMPKGMEQLDPRRFGGKKYGPLGRLWYGAPPRSRAVMAAPFVTGGGIYSWDKITDDPKIPPDRD